MFILEGQMEIVNPCSSIWAQQGQRKKEVVEIAADGIHIRSPCSAAFPRLLSDIQKIGGCHEKGCNPDYLRRRVCSFLRPLH